MTDQDMANVNFFVDDEFVINFNYPAGMSDHLKLLDERIAALNETTEYVPQALAFLLIEAVEAMPPDFQNSETTDWDMEEQSRLHLLLCVFMRIACSNSDRQPQAGKQYNFELGGNDEMVLEVYEIEPETIH